MFKSILVITGIVLLPVVLYGLHRFCLRLEDSGYIYYRTKPSGGGGIAGAVFEFDKLIRPSTEHVVATLDGEHESQTVDGE
jgi:hypothetical protein